MLNFNINLTSLAIILWSGMLIIAGSIWVLSSQVRKLADILEAQAQQANLARHNPSAPNRQAWPHSPSLPARRRGDSSRVVRGSLARTQIAYAALTSAATTSKDRRDEERLAS